MTEPSLPGRPVDLPLPPEIDRAFGYPGNARYVAFYWDADSDHLRFNDGISDGNGATWAYQLYARHPAVEGLLRPFDLTSFESELCIVLDREGSRLSIASGDQSAQFLREHRPPLPPSPPMTEEQRVAAQRSLVEQITQGWEEVPVDQEAVRRAMDEQRGRVGRMMSFLEMCPVPKAGEGRGA